MATFQEVKAFIDDKIKDNENGEITGSVLNEALTLLLGAIPEGGSITIVDNLDSSDSNSALSAKQGNALKEMILDCPTSEDFIATLREVTGAMLIYDEASFLRWWNSFHGLLGVTANAPLAYIFDAVGFYLIDYVQGLTDAGEIEIQYNKDDKRYSRIYNTNTGVVISTSEITTGGGGSTIDESVLDAYTPLIRDFSDDFNNDFTR